MVNSISGNSPSRLYAAWLPLHFTYINTHSTFFDPHPITNYKWCNLYTVKVVNRIMRESQHQMQYKELLHGAQLENDHLLYTWKAAPQRLPTLCLSTNIYLRDKGLTNCCDNDVEQNAQPKLTMQPEGDFPLCFTALDRGLCSEAERAQVAIKQHPTRRGAQTQHSWCAFGACVSPQRTVTHSSLVLEIAAQTVCFYIHSAAPRSWLLQSLMVFLDPRALRRYV